MGALLQCESTLSPLRGQSKSNGLSRWEIFLAIPGNFPQDLPLEIEQAK
jgi:hypothetical protein